MKKRFLSILLGLCVALSLLPMVALAAEGETANEPSAQSTDDPQIALEGTTATVNYVDADGNSQSQARYTVVTGSDTTWNNGWYVVNSDVTINGTVTLNGDVHLILCDGCTLTVSNGIERPNNSDTASLTIYGQSGGTGALTVTASNAASSDDSVYCIEVKSLTVNGGNVSVTAGVVSTTGNCSNAKSYGIYTYGMTVNGGTVTATAGSATASGNDGERNDAESYGIYLREGNLTATGSTVTGTAGDAESTSGNAVSYGIYLEDGDLSATNSTVSGTAGDATSNGSNDDALYARSYGIRLKDGNLSATNSTVSGTAGTAKSAEKDAESYGIYLREGKLTAKTDSTVTGTGGTATSTNSSAYSYGVKANNLTVSAGNVTGVGGSAESTDGVFCEGTISGCTVSFMKDENTSYATVVVASGSTVAKPATPDAPDGCNCFAGWYEKENGEFKGAAFNFVNTAITDNITLYAKWGTHTGGTATCKEKAVCDYCGESYGELDAGNHTAFKRIEAKAATTEAEGNIEYWYCEACGKHFSDKEGKTEITLADTVVAKLVKTNDGEEIPKTGDNGHMALLLALLFVSGGALLGTNLCGKRRSVL